MKNHSKKCFIQAYGAPLLWESTQTVFGYHNHTWRYGQNWPLAYSNAQKSATVNHMTCLVHLRLYSFISTCSSSWMIHRRWWPRRLPSSLWSSYFFYFSVWHWVINLFLLFCRHLCLYKAHNKFFHCGRHQRHQRHHYQIIDQKYILWMERKTKLNWSAFLWLLPFLNLVHSQTPCQEWFSVKNRNCIKVLI